MSNNKYVLITGASSGIGYEFAKVFAKNGYNLVLVARSEDKLNSIKQELQNQHKIECHVIVQDLAQINSALDLYRKVQELGIEVDTLINNAGFGIYGAYANSSFDREEQMMHLNMITLAQLTKFFLKDMILRNSGNILNVASTAAFLPGPYMAIYYATKAFVLSLTEAIAEEVSSKNVHITCLCPGPTRTKFFLDKSMDDSGVKDAGDFSATKVAEMGFEGLQKNKTIVIAAPFTQRISLTLFARFVPRSIARKIAKRFNTEG